jgi:hypothetical protein
MTAITRKVSVSELERKYPSFSAEFAKNWRPILRKALAEQVAKNSLSKILRGVKEITRNHFTILLDDAELNKVVDMISTRFNSRKLSPEWDDWRNKLPNLFPEKSVGQLLFLEDGNGIPDKFSIRDAQKENLCSIIIHSGDFRAEYNNVPKEIAYTINSELSKSLS